MGILSNVRRTNTAFPSRRMEDVPMEAFVDWLSHHVLTAILIVGTVFAVAYVISNRKALFWKE